MSYMAICGLEWQLDRRQVRNDDDISNRSVRCQENPLGYCAPEHNYITNNAINLVS